MRHRWKMVITSLLVVGLALGVTGDVLAQRHVEIIKKERSTRGPWLGVYLQNVTSEIAKEQKLKTEEGAYVARVVRKSPADSAGIKKGDVIVEFNGRKIYEADNLARAVKKADVGTRAKIVLMREGSKKELQVTLKKDPRRRITTAFAPRGIPHRMMIFRGTGTMGLTLMELNPQLGKYFEAPEGEGVLVTRVKESSEAERAGFKAGDIILKIANEKVERIRDIRRQLSEYEEGEKVAFEILRKGSRMTLTTEVQESDNFHGFEYMMGEMIPPEVPEDIDIEIFGPDEEDILELRMELDGLRDKIKEQSKELKKQIQKEAKKVRIRSEI